MYQESLAAGFLGLVAAFSLILEKSITLAVVDSPDWMQHILGPFGVAVVMTIAVIWFARRMDRAEEREVERQKAREALLETLVTNNARLAVALERNSDILDKVEQHFHDSH